MHSIRGFFLAVMLFAATAACSGCEDGKASATYEPTAEELRLQLATTLDSVSLDFWVDTGRLEAAARLDTITAEAWLLVDDDTGLVISQRQPRERMFPASLTKMMTALLAIEHGQMGDTIRVGKHHFITRDSHLRQGYSFVALDLLREMMLFSDNVGAYALALHVAGDTTTFYKKMNDKAAYLGMGGTHFASTNGLPNDSNYSTALDLMALARYSMRDTIFASIVGTAQDTIRLTDGRTLPCRNTNALLTQYDGCIGVKTGFTRKAGHCIAVAAERKGSHRLMLVLLKSTSSKARFAEAAALLDHGFRVMEAYDKATHL